MNIHDVVTATQAAEKVLAQKTALSALECMEICVAFQNALLDAELGEPTSRTDDDPTRWCNACGARTKERCDCGPIADNE